MKHLLLIFFSLFSFTSLLAQELDCQVRIMTPQLQETERQVYSSMENRIREFINTTNWIEDKFQPEERITCNLVLTITAHPKADQFEGTLQIQASRPVYGSNYSTPTLNLVDEDIAFQYAEFQPLEYIEGSAISNLTSLLAYYSYLILAIDYDTYGMLGGTPYYQKAQDIALIAMNGSEPAGWESTAGQNRNRYWLISQLMDNRFRPLREALYLYHRQGMDFMSSDPEKGRENIVSAIKLLEKAHRNYPNTYLMRTFFDAKSEEIISIFSEAPATDKTAVLETLRIVDVANVNQYEEKIR